MSTLDMPTESEADVSAIVDGYLSGWNEVDRVERAEIIERYWQDDCMLVDPPLAAAGHEGVNAVIAALQLHYPDHRFVRVGGLDSHHDAFRVGWELRGPTGAVALAGTDFGVIGGDGRLARVTGFFEASRSGVQ